MSSKKDYKDLCRSVANLLREKRIEQGMSMTLLAEKSGLSQQMVSYVERGMRIPSLETLFRITESLQIELATVISEAVKTESK